LFNQSKDCFNTFGTLTSSRRLKSLKLFPNTRVASSIGGEGGRCCDDDVEGNV
jgi:hypothetical protein